MADEKKIKARVLVDTGEHKCNDIISGAEAEAAVADGWADSNPAAVAYAEKLRRQSGAAEPQDA